MEKNWKESTQRDCFRVTSSCTDFLPLCEPSVSPQTGRLGATGSCLGFQETWQTPNKRLWTPDEPETQRWWPNPNSQDDDQPLWLSSLNICRWRWLSPPHQHQRTTPPTPPPHKAQTHVLLSGDTPKGVRTATVHVVCNRGSPEAPRRHFKTVRVTAPTEKTSGNLWQGDSTGTT